MSIGLGVNIFAIIIINRPVRIKLKQMVAGTHILTGINNEIVPDKTGEINLNIFRCNYTLGINSKRNTKKTKNKKYVS